MGVLAHQGIANDESALASSSYYDDLIQDVDHPLVSPIPISAFVNNSRALSSKEDGCDQKPVHEQDAVHEDEPHECLG